MGLVKIGIDVGNSDTKSPHTSIPSGIESYTARPSMAKEYLFYNGIYYIPTYERAYLLDKTSSPTAFILTLFSIGKEIVSRLDKVSDKQAEIDKIDSINLGVGLPPGHLKLGDATKQYYRKQFGDGVVFEYCGYRFHLKLNFLQVSPQGYAAATTNRKIMIPSTFSTYTIVDIGGITVDIIPIINGTPNPNKCDSIEIGILRMFDGLATKINNEKQFVLDYNIIQGLLLGNPTILPDEIKKEAFHYAEEWTGRILNTIRQRGFDFNTTPFVFMGGGSKLLKRYISKNPLVIKAEYITNPNANAIGYQNLLSLASN